MPIRFRCAFCNQLMAIARRKVGTVVRCPKCAGEIIVPSPDGSPLPEQEVDEPDSAGFDGPNLDVLGNEPGPQAPTVKAPTETAPKPRRSSSTSDSLPSVQLPYRRGLFLPLSMVIVSIVVIILLLIVAFVLGLVVGRSKTAPAKHAHVRWSDTAKGSGR